MYAVLSKNPHLIQHDAPNLRITTTLHIALSSRGNTPQELLKYTNTDALRTTPGPLEREDREGLDKLRFFQYNMPRIIACAVENFSHA